MKTVWINPHPKDLRNEVKMKKLLLILIVGSLFMPYVSVLGFELTGIEITELLIEGMSSTDLSDSSDTGDDGDIIIHYIDQDWS